MPEPALRGYYYSANNLSEHCRNKAEKSMSFMGVGCFNGFLKPLNETDIEKAAIAIGRVGKCHVGTEFKNGQCVAHADICGNGTKWDNAQKKCLQENAPSSYCGGGTKWDGSKCVPSVPTVVCDHGTRLEGNKCVVSCNPGNRWRHDLQMCALEHETANLGKLERALSESDPRDSKTTK